MNHPALCEMRSAVFLNRARAVISGRRCRKLKKHYGWTVWGILGFVFAPIALIFIPAGLIVHAARPGETGQAILYTFCGIGFTFLLLGLGFLLIDIRRRYLMRRAYLGGNAVTAKVVAIRNVNNVNMNGQHPVVLDCEYQGNIYHSRYLYRNVPEIGTEVTVYVDRMDDRIGFVDICR